jgi:hypothetical protein
MVADGGPGDPEWYPLQHFFGLTTFGINVFRAVTGQETLVEEHDELASGQQELYLLLDGEAEFELDGDRVRATRQTAIAVTDPAVRRAARAVQPGTMLLVVGAGEGAFTSTWNPGHFANLPQAEG